MRKVTFGGANSLDNFIARKNDAVDWLLWNKEVAVIMKDFWKTIDTMVMGRRTYEVAMKSFGGDSVSYPGVTTYVFSRTLTQLLGSNKLAGIGLDLRYAGGTKYQAAALAADEYVRGGEPLVELVEENSAGTARSG
jgi:dihydrofolate reductase